MNARLLVVLLVSLLQVISLSLVTTERYSDRSFVVDPKANCFRKDGKCFQYIAASMHYYRFEC